MTAVTRTEPQPSAGRGTDRSAGHRSSRLARLVKVDLVLAGAALAVIVGVTAADHAAHGSFSGLTGLLGG